MDALDEYFSKQQENNDIDLNFDKKFKFNNNKN